MAGLLESVTSMFWKPRLPPRATSGPTTGKRIFSAWLPICLVSLAKAHAYSDGNKRIAIISAVAFLGGNGIELSIGAGELVPQTIRAARCQEQDRALEEEAIALWLELSSRMSNSS
jgi:hypothetical protein